MHHSLNVHMVWRRVQQRAFTGHHSRSYCSLLNPSSQVFEDLPLLWFGEYLFCDTTYCDLLFSKYFISKVSLKLHVDFFKQGITKKMMVDKKKSFKK